MELRKRHKGHARALKNIEGRYDMYARWIELEASSCAGEWLTCYCPNASELRLDLGCGKGQFVVELAQKHPDVLFVGLDYDRTCIALAAKKAWELELPNVVFALADGEDVTTYFAPGEVSRIYLNFSTPHPRKKHAEERLTYVDNLIAYREILSDDGCIDMKTDSPPFFEFSLIQFEMAGYDIVWSTTDLHAESEITCANTNGVSAELPSSSASTANEVACSFISSPITEYEARLCELGAKVHALRAVKTKRPVSREQTAELSLFEYLPEDLNSLEYVPFGMEGYVFNIKNRRAKEQARTLPAE